jgi:hypothetical protein
MEGLLPIIRRKRRLLIPMQNAEGRMQNAESPDRLKPGQQTEEKEKEKEASSTRTRDLPALPSFGKAGEDEDEAALSAKAP